MIFIPARGKIKKYTPLLAGIGVKVIAVIGLLFGGLTLLVTKALVVAKLAFLVAAALGIQKLLSGGGLNNISGKVIKACNTKSLCRYPSLHQNRNRLGQHWWSSSDPISRCIEKHTSTYKKIDDLTSVKNVMIGKTYSKEPEKTFFNSNSNTKF